MVLSSKIKTGIILLIICFIYNITTSYSQVNTDSLHGLIKKTTDNKKAEMCNSIAKDLLDQNPDESLKFAEMALKYAEKYNNTEQENFSYINSGDALGAQGKNDKAAESYQKAIDGGNKAKDDRIVALAYLGLGGLSFYEGNYDKALDEFKKAASLSEKTDNNEVFSESLNNIGVINKMRGHYSEALSYYKKALIIDQNNAAFKNISTDLNNIGAVYRSLGQYEKAIGYYNQALEIDLKLPISSDLAVDYNNLGKAYFEKGQYDKALENYLKTLEIYYKLKKNENISGILNNIGGVFQKCDKHDKAMEYYQKAYSIDKEANNEKNLAFDLNNIATLYVQIKKYNEAVENFKQAREIYSKLKMEDAEAATINNIGGIFLEMKQFDKALSFFKQSIEINKRLGKDADVGTDYTSLGQTYYNMKNYSEALNCYNEALVIAKKVNSFKLYMDVYDGLTILYKQKGDYKNALESHMAYSNFQDSVFSENTNQQLAKLQAVYETDQKEKEIQLKNAELVQKDLQYKKQRLLIYSLFGGMALIIALIFQVYYSLRRKKKQNLLLAIEKARSEELLLNIIPEKVLPELKKEGFVKPESFDNVTIFFSDIEGFTSISSHMQPQLLIDQLNQIFTAFDEIMSKHNCERIKTIGDAYMAVCGIPVKDPNHAENITEAAMAIRDYMNKRNETAEYKMAIRIGINTGRVVGGIVGVKKYAYDVFGDAVNTASRMEHYSESMRINVSEGTYHRLNDKFKFIEREPLEVKGKGMMKMYFLDE